MKVDADMARRPQPSKASNAQVVRQRVAGKTSANPVLEHRLERLGFAGHEQDWLDRYLLCDHLLSPPSAKPRQRFEATSRYIRDLVAYQWAKTQSVREQTQPKRIHYLSMEFLLGRTLRNNMMNLAAEPIVRRVMEREGWSLEHLIDEEPDAGLGNGGLGRLAACFIDSLATLQYSAIGYGLRYEYGMFRQSIRDGWQLEQPDNWLRNTDPWEIVRPGKVYVVPLNAHFELQGSGIAIKRNRPSRLLGIAYDRPVVGYGAHCINTLRLWAAAAPQSFDFAEFSHGDFASAVIQNVAADSLTRVLYPDDSTEAGRALRFLQQYFMVSCSLQDNLLHIVILYNRLRHDSNQEMTPRTFFFAGKAAPAYHLAKLIIKLINNVADTINSDSVVRGRLNVLFLPEYNVSMAERLIPASDVSEQISTAGFEASGTGNMKFMMNGALTIGTRDGATIEMAQEAGEENFFFFGLTAQQVSDGAGWYDPNWHYANDPETRAALDLIFSNHFSRHEPGIFDPLRGTLLTGGDRFRHLADLTDYARAHRDLAATYADAETWASKAIINVACSGLFSSDRAVTQYANEIWKVKPCPVP